MPLRYCWESFASRASPPIPRAPRVSRRPADGRAPVPPLAGRRAQIFSSYDDARLTSLASAIGGARVDVWCIFDNTGSGSAAGNALDLRALATNAPVQKNAPGVSGTGRVERVGSPWVKTPRMYVLSGRSSRRRGTLSSGRAGRYVELDRLVAAGLDFDVVRPGFQVHVLEDAIEVVHDAHVVAVGEDARVARRSRDPDAAVKVSGSVQSIRAACSRKG